MGKTVTTYLIDGDPQGSQYVFISNKISQINYFDYNSFSVLTARCFYTTILIVVYKKSLQVFCRLKTAKSRIYIFCFLCFFIHIYVICHSDKSSMTVIFRFSEIIIFSSFIFFISRIIALRSRGRSDLGR